MRAILFISTIFLFNSQLFCQFKHEQNSSGDPITEIIDFSQMKQGNWNYVDLNNSIFRVETFKDNELVSNIYKMNSSKTIDVSKYKQKNINMFTQKNMKDLMAKLNLMGNGEIIITDDNQVFIHFYFNKVKSTPDFKSLSITDLKNYSLQKTIIFF
jgi:hypothetical protein